MTTATKLDSFFINELNSDLREVLITRDNKGRYSLFGKYFISPQYNCYFKVYSPNKTEEFAYLINAVAWCTLTNAGKFREANRILTLDLKLHSINFDVLVHRRMLKLSQTESAKNIAITKLQTDLINKRLVIDQINSYVTNSKNIQNKRFREPIHTNFHKIR